MSGLIESNAVNVEGKKALVVGGGTMGAGIAQSLLQIGVTVTLSESSEAASKAARERVEAGLARAKKPEKIAQLESIVSLPQSLDVDLCVEAIYEDPVVKGELLSRLSGIVPADAIIASNTSSLSITQLAQSVSNPNRFLGMHFFNPVPVSLLVELVVHPATSEESIARSREWVHALSKEEIVVTDAPGFATSRLGLVIGLEAIRMVEEGVASAEDIDKGMVLGYRFPMGPLRLTDLVGLDVRLAIAEHLASTLGDRFTPPALLREMVGRGELGKKSGKGFFDWRTS
jgi:3-hydroxybutyryl-CoA dehydrogenase